MSALHSSAPLLTLDQIPRGERRRLGRQVQRRVGCQQPDPVEVVRPGVVLNGGITGQPLGYLPPQVLVLGVGSPHRARGPGVELYPRPR